MIARATASATLLLGILVIGVSAWPAPTTGGTKEAVNAPAGGVDKPTSNDAQARNADVLERKARVNFGALTAAELRLVRNAPYRSLVWSGASSDPADPSNDPSKGANWEAARTIREELICWLLVDAEASRLVHPSGIGIAGARIVRTIDLSYAASELPLTIVRSFVPAGLDLSNARIGPLVVRDSWTGAIIADQALVRGDLALRYGRYGPVSLFRAQINGDLDFRGAQLAGEEPLLAVETKVEGDALFQEDFQTAGLLDFRLANVKSSLSFNDAHFTGTRENGLTAERAIIGGTVYWVKVEGGPRTILNLGNARTAALWDDRASWPLAGNLVLAGFVYDSFSGGPTDAVSRLEWLHLQPRSLWTQPQPYRRLARTMRDSGNDAGASEVEIAREKALARYGNLSAAERAWKFALWATIGYGYRPLRALWWILLFVAMGTIFFGLGYRARLIAPTEAEAYESFNKSGEPPVHYPPFSSFIYSLENFLPVVDLHQGAYWRPNPRHRVANEPRLFGRRVALGVVPGMVLRWYLWVHILAGWAITPLLFAGLSGLLRSD